jgi:hypothetical protein
MVIDHPKLPAEQALTPKPLQELAADVEQERHCGNAGGLAGAPGEVRTPDLQIRSLPLYPSELQARI